MQNYLIFRGASLLLAILICAQAGAEPVRFSEKILDSLYAQWKAADSEGDQESALKIFAKIKKYESASGAAALVVEPAADSSSERPSPESSASGSGSAAAATPACGALGVLNGKPCSNAVVKAADEMSATVDDLTKAAKKGDFKEVKKQAAALDRIVKDAVPADIGWGETGDDFYLGIYGGLEGTSINDFDESANFRAGLTAYNQFIRFQPRRNSKFAPGTLVTQQQLDAKYNAEKRKFKGISRRRCHYLSESEYAERGGVLKGAQAQTAGKNSGIGSEAESGSPPSEERFYVLDQPQCGAGFGLHGWLSVYSTSSAEQTEIMMPTEMMADGMTDNTPPTDMMQPDVGDDMTGAGDLQGEIRYAYESELGIFAPVWQKTRDNSMGHLLIGPTIQAAITKIESQDKFGRRYYGGARMAFSPETYLDVLYGKTERVDGRRLEIKGQIPVGKLSENSRLFFGGVANLGVKNSGAEPDSYRLFLTWNTNFLDILGAN